MSNQSADTSQAVLLWQLIGVASVVGNVVLAWIKIKRSNTPMQIGPSPLEVKEHERPVRREEFESMRHRVANIEAEIAANKREIVEEIIKFRENNHKQFQELHRALGRLEGDRIKL